MRRSNMYPVGVPERKVIEEKRQRRERDIFLNEV